MFFLRRNPNPESNEQKIKKHVEDIEFVYQEVNKEKEKIDANDHLLRAAYVIYKVSRKIQPRPINYVEGFSSLVKVNVLKEADNVLNEEGLFDLREIQTIKQNIEFLIVEYEERVNKSEFMDFITKKILELRRNADSLKTTKNQLNKEILSIKNLLREKYGLHYDYNSRKLISLPK